MNALGLTDGRAGNIAQVRALAGALGANIEMIDISLHAPWRWLPNRAFDLGLAKFFPPTNIRLPFPAPDLVISCGRKGALASAFLSTANRQPPTRYVHIQDPQMSPARFDKVIAMAHDRISGPNVIKTPYALHHLPKEALDAARSHWEPKFSHLPRPWSAVLVGGSTNKYTLTPGAMRDLIAQIDTIEGSLLITSSRRTGEENVRRLSEHFGGQPAHAFLYTGEMENPYMGMLACADRLYVTNDSVNMISEALATGKPVTVLPLLGHEGTKPARFAESLDDIRISPGEMMEELAASIREMLARSA